jgi:hypothetical protein
MISKAIVMVLTVLEAACAATEQSIKQFFTHHHDIYPGFDPSIVRAFSAGSAPLVVISVSLDTVFSIRFPQAESIEIHMSRILGRDYDDATFKIRGKPYERDLYSRSLGKGEDVIPNLENELKTHFPYDQATLEIAERRRDWMLSQREQLKQIWTEKPMRLLVGNLVDTLIIHLADETVEWQTADDHTPERKNVFQIQSQPDIETKLTHIIHHYTDLHVKRAVKAKMAQTPLATRADFDDVLRRVSAMLD